MSRLNAIGFLLQGQTHSLGYCADQQQFARPIGQYVFCRACERIGALCYQPG